MSARKYAASLIDQLVNDHGVTVSTVRMWLRSGKLEYHIKRREEWAYLRAECARNGTTGTARYARVRDRYPLEAVAGPMKRVKKETIT